jgi:hypothetical protein
MAMITHFDLTQRNITGTATYLPSLCDFTASYKGNFTFLYKIRRAWGSVVDKALRY